MKTFVQTGKTIKCRQCKSTDLLGMCNNKYDKGEKDMCEPKYHSCIKVVCKNPTCPYVDPVFGKFRNVPQGEYHWGHS